MLVFLLFLDIFALAGAVAITVCVVTMKRDQLPASLTTLVNIAVLLTTYSLTAILCNCLAVQGLRNDSRTFLVPYLIFLPLVLTSLIVYVVNTVLTRGLTPESLFIPMVLGLVLSVVWLRIVRHWILMGRWLPRPLSGPRGRRNRDSEAAMSPGSSLQPPVLATPDHPPEYDHVVNKETPPPCYEEVVSEVAITVSK